MAPRVRIPVSPPLFSKHLILKNFPENKYILSYQCSEKPQKKSGIDYLLHIKNHMNSFSNATDSVLIKKNNCASSNEGELIVIDIFPDQKRLVEIKKTLL